VIKEVLRLSSHVIEGTTGALAEQHVLRFLVNEFHTALLAKRQSEYRRLWVNCDFIIRMLRKMAICTLISVDKARVDERSRLFGSFHFRVLVVVQLFLEFINFIHKRFKQVRHRRNVQA
jgi:hypothetical protein